MGIQMQETITASRRYFLLESYLLKGGSQARAWRVSAGGACGHGRAPEDACAGTDSRSAGGGAHAASADGELLRFAAGTGHGEAPVARRGSAREALARWEAGDEAPYETRNEIVLVSAPYCPAFPPTAIDAAKPPRSMNSDLPFAHRTAVAGAARALWPDPRSKSSSAAASTRPVQLDLHRPGPA